MKFSMNFLFFVVYDNNYSTVVYGIHLDPRLNGEIMEAIIDIDNEPWGGGPVFRAITGVLAMTLPAHFDTQILWSPGVRKVT